jgi:hypothetical protein
MSCDTPGAPSLSLCLTCSHLSFFSCSGYQSFLHFLHEELSAESALFWRHVDQLEDQCALWLMATPTNKRQNYSSALPQSQSLLLSKQELISNAQQLQQLLQIPDTTNDLCVFSEDRSASARVGADERKEVGEEIGGRAGSSESIQKKKMDPNMSASRIKIAYSASSFSYSEDNPITRTSVSAPLQSRNSYCTLYAQRHQEKIIHHLEAILLSCEEIERLYLTGLSQFQISIPATMGQQVKAEWEYLREKIKRCIAEEKDKGMPVSVAEYQAVLQLISQLFSRPKHEVYLVLRDDSFARYNKTRAFDDFITKMRPYV